VLITMSISGYDVFSWALPYILQNFAWIVSTLPLFTGLGWRHWGKQHILIPRSRRSMLLTHIVDRRLQRTSNMKAKGFCFYKRDDFNWRISRIQRKKLLDHHGRELMIAPAPHCQMTKYENMSYPNLELSQFFWVIS
jgi:hypothetical protein